MARCVKFARPMITKFLFAFATFTLVGCVAAEDTSSTDDSSDVPDVPHTSACSGGTYQCFAQIVTEDDTAAIKSFATASGFGPADLISAYHLKAVTTSPGTIAIVDAFNYSAAESDLAKYRSQYGLPACTSASGCFKRVNQSGKASPLPKNAPAGDDWTVEAALDLDMASAACPTCKLILVEADDDQGDGLYIANSGAASLAPTVISNSWGGPESGDEASLETYFNHPGIGIFVSSGDSGYTGSSPQYPSTSAHVTAVGGTTLTRSTNTRGWADKAWSDAGSSCSSDIAKPSYQTSSACSRRAASDVSAVADPNTGVAVYNAGSGGWIVVGGTSASSPLVAGMYALYGLGTKAPGWAYGNAGDFYDVKSGKNGSCSTALCKAGVGWDGPTGLGVPNGLKL
jgi:subtilase family serine protease